MSEETEPKVQAPIREQNAVFVRQRLDGASELGVRVGVLLALLMRGWHHVCEQVDIDCVDWAKTDCITTAFRRPLCTVDFDELTRLVFLAHDEALRVEILAPPPPDSPEALALGDLLLGLGAAQQEIEGAGLIVKFTARQRAGEFYEICPTLETKVLKHRCQFPESGVLQ